MLRARESFCISADRKLCHHLFLCLLQVGDVHPARMQLHSQPQINQRDLIRCFPLVTLVTEHKDLHVNSMNSEMSLWATKACAAYVQGLLHHTISQFPPFSQQRKPWLTIHHIIDEKSQPTILSRLAEPAHTHLSTLSEAALLCDSPARTSLSFKSPPEGCGCGKEGASALIWLCNTRPFAIGQWNSISFNPPSVNIHLKSLHRHCLLFARSHLNLSSAAAFSEKSGLS